MLEPIDSDEPGIRIKVSPPYVDAKILLALLGGPVVAMVFLTVAIASSALLWGSLGILATFVLGVEAFRQRYARDGGVLTLAEFTCLWAGGWMAFTTLLAFTGAFVQTH